MVALLVEAVKFWGCGRQILLWQPSLLSLAKELVFIAVEQQHGKGSANSRGSQCRKKYEEEEKGEVICQRVEIP